MTAWKYLQLCIIIIFFAGCASVPPKSTADNAVNKKVNDPGLPYFEPARTAEGSLWSEISGTSLFPDLRARKVGDIVTVRIVEDPEASLNANTNTSRSSDVTASKLKFLGFMKALAEKNQRLAQDPGADDLVLASLGMKFDGKGTSDRDGHVKAYIAVTILQVLPNGNLYVNGKREIRVNNETQFISLSGVIRPEDIGPTNEISSTYVASAKITYSGQGPIADKQRPGWLGRVVDYVWPF
ncbi:MAG: flagellar basal body L-ring protein FlgH [Proteobacteria bacterium]|nr:flagellar basal body L-ring protein FlgH [Pseudomonadota bacterium]